MTTMYHGTSEKAAGVILRQGFNLALAGARQKALRGEDVAETPGIFLTTDKQRAEWYAGPDRGRAGLNQGGVVIEVSVSGRLMTDTEWFRLLGATQDDLGDTAMWPSYSDRMATYAEAIKRARKQGFAGYHEHQGEYLVFDPKDIKIKGAYDADTGRPLRASAHRVARRWLQARSQESLREAQEFYTNLLTYLKREPPLLRMKKGGKLSVQVDARKFGRGPVYEVKLWFLPHTPGTLLREDRREIIVGAPGGVAHMDKYHDMESWELAMTVAMAARKALIHELTHHIDRGRVGQEGWDAASRSYPENARGLDKRVEYFNHPIETNAYFQQAADALSEVFKSQFRALKPDRPNDSGHQVAVMELSDLALWTFDTFFDKIQKQWPRDMWKALTPDNQRRFKARAFEVYELLVGEARERFKDLVAREDPAADMVFKREHAYLGMNPIYGPRPRVKSWAARARSKPSDGRT